MPLKYLSICSGIEAATVAWHEFGWEPVAFSEIDKFPSAVLSAHYPDVPNLGDMTAYTEWPEEMLGEVDILVGGTPCQAFSVAGQRRSLDDERGNLSLVYVNLYHHINEVRKRHGRPPAIALWENVPGVLSTKDNAFGCFIGGLLGCDEAPATESGKWDKAGFLGSETVRVGYRVLDAQYFGVAQRRRRVFLAAVPSELVERFGERACPSEILSLRESVLGNPPTRGAAWEVAPTMPARRTAGGGLGTDFDCDGELIHPELANPLTARMSKGINTTCDEGQTPVVAFHPTQDPISSVDGSTHAMGCGSRQDCCTQAVAFKESQSGTRLGDGHATIDANKGSRRQEGVVLSLQVRRLTPTECEFLQGFPAGYTDVVYRNKPAADGPRYRALGNSMAVPCMWWLGHRIREAITGN